MFMLPLSLPSPRPVSGLKEGNDIAPDDAITAMVIAMAILNFIVFFINAVV
jgi:hypothetical protein